MMKKVERMSGVEDALFCESKESKVHKEAMMNKIERMSNVEDAIAWIKRNQRKNYYLLKILCSMNWKKKKN